MRRIILWVTSFFIALSFAFAATAQTSNAEIEARAKDVGRSLRCVVCQNQSIDESDAPLAMDMRKLVRERLKEGDSNAEVIAYMQERYGDFVLLKPPVQSNTYLLWFTPFLLLLAGLIWFIKTSRKTEPNS
ncbi:cytochrome c-type biogenesis protein CcmH [Hellea sp.]|nr:cytochrome c-type biogenesis protein CcmH [Hellea sp.]